MKKIELQLQDELYQFLEDKAADQKISIEDYAVALLEQRMRVLKRPIKQDSYRRHMK